MQPLLYDELVSWYRLLDPPHDHVDEVAAYEAALLRAAEGPVQDLLELGAGAGHNAVHLKERFRCTLTDLSPAMLELSRELNPECEHRLGDMRTLRLERTFDVVLVHDAVMYMVSEEDLVAAIRTAFEHTRPGGAALFAPDFVRETFSEATHLLTEDDGARALRCLEWAWDPDPADDQVQVEFSLLMREGGRVRAVHDQHRFGLFSRETWTRLLEEAGYRVDLAARPLDDGGYDAVFICRRPLQ